MSGILSQGRLARRRAVAGKLFFNEDGTQQYYRPEVGTMGTGHLDRIIDSLWDSQVRVLIPCVNGKKAFFASRVWEPYREGYDPNRAWISLSWAVSMTAGLVGWRRTELYY